MGRTCKSRRVCVVPINRKFTPQIHSIEEITLTIEQMEVLRLTDYEGLDQDTAAFKMGVSRGTLQRILYLARHKIADGLLNGKNIIISGGNYTLTESVCNLKNKCICCKFDKNPNNKEES